MKILSYRFLILSIIGVFNYAISHVNAQHFKNFSIQRLSQDDGLSQGSNYFRYEDSHGFMWITGNDALNRFDGSSVKVYNLDRFFKNCARLIQGYGFAEDGKNLYVGSTRGLYKYDYDLDAFTLLDVYQGISKAKTAIPFGFENGKIWCFNEEWKIVSYDIKTGKASLEVQIPLPAIKSVNVYSIESDIFYYRMPFFDLNDNICFVGKKNIVLYNVRDKSIRYPLKHSPIDITLLSVAYDKSEDKTYIGTLNKGFIVFEKNFKNHNFFIAGITVSNIAIHGKY